MTLLEIIIICLGGFFGAILRYVISRKLNGVKNFPYGTLLVNLVGSLLIGVVFGIALPRIWTFFLASGFAGALTTFSTMNKEILNLWQGRKKKEAIVYVFVTYCGGLILAWIGYSISSF